MRCSPPCRVAHVQHDTLRPSAPGHRRTLQVHGSPSVRRSVWRISRVRLGCTRGQAGRRRAATGPPRQRALAPWITPCSVGFGSDRLLTGAALTTAHGGCRRPQVFAPTAAERSGRPDSNRGSPAPKAESRCSKLVGVRPAQNAQKRPRGLSGQVIGVCVRSQGDTCERTCLRVVGVVATP